MIYLRYFLVWSLLSSSLLFAQQSRTDYSVYLNNWHESFPANSDRIMGSEWGSEDFVNGTVYRLVQFERLLSEQEKDRLAGAKVQLLDYIPNNVWLCAIPTQIDRNFLAQFPIRGIMPMPIEAKVRANLTQLPLPAWAIQTEGTIDLHIMRYSGVPEAFLNSALIRSGALLLPEKGANWQTIRVSSEKIMQVAQLPGVQLIEPIDPPAESENYVARGQHRATALDPGHIGGRHYNGQGVVVGVGDDGIIGPHIDFTGRFDNSSCGGADAGDHADHVTGTIFGAGNLNPDHRGMAPGSYIFTYYGGQSLIGFLPTHVNTRNIVITNTSQSNGCNAGYTILTQAVDNLVHDNTHLLMVYSAGNEGVSIDCNYGAGTGWGNITGGHKMAKNCLTVGALSPTDGIASFSSRGPAYDGRIKPEICGKGMSQISTQDGNRYQSAQGTSMSAPGLAGVSAQLYQAYKEANGGNNPNSGLIKALIMNNADDLGNAGPDFIYGYGRVNALRAVEAIEDGRFFSDNINTGETDTFTITVPAGMNDLRVMAYWHDKETAINASRALINDLNLTVIDPNGNPFLPWVLDPTPNPVNLNTPAVRGLDDLNNMEQVTLDTVPAGVYTIIVHGLAVPQGPQEYFITYTAETGGVRLTYPFGGEEMIPGKPERIYWDAKGVTDPFKLEYTTDNGTTWNVIDSTISPTLRSAIWVVPQINCTGQGWMRISRNGDTDMTDLPVTFSKQPGNLNISASCLTSFTLSWDTVAGAAGYEVSMLGNMYMDSVGTTTGSSFTITGVSSSNSYWVSVRAISAEGTYGRRAIAIEKTPGLWMCQEPGDVGVSALIQPSPGPSNDCGPNNGTVQVLLTNYSPDTSTGFPVNYQINGGSIITETFSGTLMPYDTASYTFSTTANFSGIGNYSIKTWTSNSLDNNPNNDTLTGAIETFSNTVVTLPYEEDFESFPTCNVVPNCEVGVCGLSGGWKNGTNNSVDDIDWRTDQGGTANSNTGPSEDHKPGTAVGKYLYLESSLCYGKTAMAITPCIDLTATTEPHLRFWFHNYGANQGSLHVDLMVDGIWVTDISSPVIGDWTNKWWEKDIDLSPWVGKIVTVRFRGITGNGDLSDMAIDDISIKDDAIAVDPTLPTDIQVWPNPSNGQLRVRFEQGAKAAGQIQLCDLNGRTLMQKAFSAGTSDLELNAKDLAAGIYIVRIAGDGFSGQLKWVKK